MVSCRPVFLVASLVLGGGILRAAMPKSSPSGEEVFRLNCGASGWDLTDPRGNFWLKDEAYSTHYRWGFVNGTPADAEEMGVVVSTALTDIPEVYRTHRWGGSDMKYRVELPNGQYSVTLHFAETYFTSAGARVFDVALQGETVLDHLDVFAQSGGQAIPFSRGFSVSVDKETLEVSFPHVYADNAFISGIEIKVQSVTDDSVLAFLQRKMFWYFWNEAGPGTGLVSDKADNWTGQHFTTASIATTGFGLSALTIGAERGWIPEEEARERIRTTLEFFQEMQGDPARSYHGMWYHFVDWTTGQRNYGSEVSTVDSALFILGALQAGEYFRTADPSIADKAEAIYRNMEWDWFTHRGGDIPFVSMGWKPEMGDLAAPDRGSFIPAWWNMYAESVFVDLLALGSPTHPIDPKAWTDMRRHGSISPDGGLYEYMHLPPLFVHQYHHLYYDLRDKNDGLADYWQAAVRAAQRDRAQCAVDSRYESDIWGLTACETQYKGYQVYGSQPDGTRDGTAAPTGPLASLPMTPTESMAAARKMFFQYKHAIWGRHGFCDSFNTSANERADYALGLDNGPIVLAIENQRTNLIRETFMRHSHVATALSRAGFVATGEAPVYFSNSEKNGNHAQYAFDNNPATRWESLWTEDNWLAVDYGRPTDFDQVRLKWETAHGKDYRIQTSDDGVAWTTVATVTDGDGGEDFIRFPRTRARLIRMVGDHRGGVQGQVWGYSLFGMVAGEGISPGDTALSYPDGMWTLSWEANGNPPGTTYGAFKSLDNVVYTQFYAGTSLSAVVKGLKPRTTYFFKVQARNLNGVVSGFDVAATTVTTPDSLLGGQEESISEGLPLTATFSGPAVPGASLYLEPLGDLPGSPPASWRPSGRACRVSVEGVETPALVLQAAGSVIGSRGAIAKWSDSSSTWNFVPPSGITSGAGVFGLFLSAPLTMEGMRAFPNPFRPSRDSWFHLKGLPEGSRVRLYTLAGERIKELDPADSLGETRWNGFNESERAVASGVYLGVVESEGQKRSFRLGVEQ